jgi:hypothetical protein
MCRTAILILFTAGIQCAMFAAPAPTIANVSSARDFVLDGHMVAAAGVSSWPLVNGDDVKTTTQPAIVYFKDGSRVQLSPASHVKVTGTSDAPKVTLMAGYLGFKKTTGSALALVDATGAPAGNGGGNGGNGGAPQTNSGAGPTYSNHSHIFEAEVLSLSLAGAGVATAAALSSASQ